MALVFRVEMVISKVFSGKIFKKSDFYHKNRRKFFYFSTVGSIFRIFVAKTFKMTILAMSLSKEPGILSGLPRGKAWQFVVNRGENL